MRRSRFSPGVLRALLATAVVLLVANFAICGYHAMWFGHRCPGCIEEDPALSADDPATHLGDDWDRRAAEAIDDSRETDLASLITRASTKGEVVETLRATVARAEEGEFAFSRSYPDATGVMLLRRPRAAYTVAADAMAADDPADRDWGIDAIEVLENRDPDSPPEPGSPFGGPERDAAIRALGRILTSDPDPDRRGRVATLFERLLPDHDQPGDD